MLKIRFCFSLLFYILLAFLSINYSICINFQFQNESEAKKKDYQKEIENGELKLKSSLKELQDDLNQQWARKMRWVPQRKNHTIFLS